VRNVDPSAGIREAYTQFVVVTIGGRTLTGVILTREGETAKDFAFLKDVFSRLVR
jgi:hypothetical protein